jgi:class 3 adenylate cyclase/pimeloyl-ACP methyl ester carboxylesterase
MTGAPETHYTRSADGNNLAYQVGGDGPLDLVFLHGGGIPIDLLSEDPGFIRLRRRLSTFSRTVWFDPRGWGASEGDPRDFLRGEISNADFTAVLDAVGFERPALVADSGSGGRAIHFSATHAERVNALVLLNSFAHYVREDDYPWGYPRQSLDRVVIAVAEGWGTAEVLEALAPSRIADERFRAWYARSERFVHGPGLVADVARASLEDDVRRLLPSISVPTLVLHREGNRYIHLGAGRYLAEHIPGAKFVVLPGDAQLFFVGDTDALVDEIEEFLTGARSGAEGDVVLAAILFTDIVASTEHQARVGPREWSRLTDQHDAMVRSALARHRGHEVKTTGDGFLATFDAAGRALRCAADILAGAKDIGLDLRAGVHTGEVEVRGDDIAGLAVAIAKRVCDLAEPGEVLVSGAIPPLVVGSGIDFVDRGEHQLKGVRGTWKLHRAVP